MADKGDLNRRLWAASDAGEEARVEALIQKGADVHSKNPRGYNGLILSSQKGHNKIVKMFLEKGVGVNTRGGRLKRTALMGLLRRVIIAPPRSCWITMRTLTCREMMA